jgi:CheY-like chemotaxis protein
MATILIVDDERPLRDLLVAVFAGSGYRVIEASDGRRALELAAAEHPDAVISDVMMPLMSGLELCRRLKADEGTRGVRVVLMSAVDQQRAEGAGADAFVAKPFDIDELERLVDGLLRAA